MVPLLNSQFKSILFTLVRLYIAVVGILIATVVLSRMTGYHIADFTRDPSAVTHSHPFVGLLSNIGILAWCAAAGICFFSAAFLRYHMIQNAATVFLLLLGTITAILLIDDLFLLHESAFPHYLGIDESIVFIFYGMMIIVFLVMCRAQILQTDFLMLLGAFGFFALSLLIDKVPDHVLPVHYLFEDGFKFFGIVIWLGYCWRSCYRIIDTHLVLFSKHSPAH